MSIIYFLTNYEFSNSHEKVSLYSKHEPCTNRPIDSNSMVQSIKYIFEPKLMFLYLFYKNTRKHILHVNDIQRVTKTSRLTFKLKWDMKNIMGTYVLTSHSILNLSCHVLCNQTRRNSNYIRLTYLCFIFLEQKHIRNTNKNIFMLFKHSILIPHVCTHHKRTFIKL